MGLSVVASFTQLSEAHVAAGALRSAGFHAEVMDQNFAVVNWFEQQVLGGIRVIVPQSELGEAVQVLREIIREKPEPGPEPHPGVGWRGLAIAFGLIIPVVALVFLREPMTWWKAVLLMIGFAGTPLAWSVVAAVKSRGREGQLLPILLSVLTVTLAGLVLSAAIGVLTQGSHPRLDTYDSPPADS